MKTEEFLCNLTALFLRYFILEPTQKHFEELFSSFSDQLVMIGTGKHEFYTSIEQVLENLKANLTEAETINFQVLDEWYEIVRLTDWQRHALLVRGMSCAPPNA